MFDIIVSSNLKKIDTTETNLANHCLHGEHLVFLVYFVFLWFSLSFSGDFAVVSVCVYQSGSLLLSCLNFISHLDLILEIHVHASKNLLLDFPIQWNVFQDKIWWFLNFICKCCNGSTFIAQFIKLVFSLFCLVCLAKALSILLIFSKKWLFTLLILYCLFCFPCHECLPWS